MVPKGPERRRRLGQVVLGAAGLVQTIPSLALLVATLPLLGIGAKPALFALFVYGLLPIVRSTHAGLRSIPEEVRTSALALGLPPLARLRLALCHARTVRVTYAALDPATQRASYQKLVDMFDISASLLVRKDSRTLLTHIGQRVVSPKDFPARASRIASVAETVSLNDVRLDDGRLIDCFSQPLWLEENRWGRFWSFRDVSVRANPHSHPTGI